MPAVNIVDKYQAIQYTGSNSADIDAAITYLDVTGESGGVLSVDSPPGNPWTVNTNYWIRFTQGMIASIHSPTDYANLYTQIATYGDIADLPSDIASLEAAVTALQAIDGILAVGVRESPLLLLNSSTVVAVDVIPALADTSYTPNVQLFASASALGSLSITAVSVVDTNTVNVTVQNSGLISLGGVHILVAVTA